MKFQIEILILLFVSLFSCKSNASKQVNLQSKSNMSDNKLEYPVNKTDEEWKQLLGDFSYSILREKATERPFSSEYEKFWEPGIYVCKGCGSELFTSDTKFDAGCGWPSFYQSIDKKNVKEILDLSHGMTRVEVVCSNCGGHLGHVFNDGYNQPTGLRYCINGASLGFKKKQ